MNYYYLGNINNFTLDNTFTGGSWDIDFTFGKGLVGSSTISLMFNRQVQGEFLIGVGPGAGVGWGSKIASGSFTYNWTEFY